jgi:hypothetical protein
VDAAVLSVIVAFAALFHLRSVAGSYFTQDDYYNFGLAAESGLSLGYLTEPVFQHLLPGARLASWLLQTVAPLSWGVAVGALLGALAASVVLLHHVLTLLVGPVWWRHPLTFVFAMSVSHTRNLEWWSGALVGIPATVTGLAAIAAWLHWRRSGRVWWLVLSAAMVLVGLGFIAKLVLIPFVLLGLRLFVLDRTAGLRSAVRVVWRERWEWVVMVLPSVGVLLVAVAFGYYRTGSLLPRSAALTEFLARAWGMGFAPSLVGLASPTGATTASLTAVVVGQLAVATAVVLTLRRNRSAWRPWVAFGITFTVLTLVVGVSRVALFGQGVALELRYFPEVTYLFPIFLALAVAPGRHLSRTDLHAERSPRPSKAALAAVAALAVALPVLAASGARAVTQGWPGFEARDYMLRVQSDIAALDDAGALPVILDGTVPAEVVAPWLAPYHQYSRVLALVEPDLVFDEASDRTAVVRPDGSLAEAVVTPLADVLTSAHLTVGGAPVTGPPGCVTAGAAPVFVEYRPPAPLGGARLAVRARHDEQAVPPPVFVDRGTGYPAVNDVVLNAGGSTLRQVGSTLAALRVDVLPGTTLCLQELEVVDITEGEPLVPR